MHKRPQLPNQAARGAQRTFLGNLRRAKDRAEFDQFMDERRQGGDPDPQPAG